VVHALTTPMKSLQVPADDTRERKFTGHSQHLLRCGDCDIRDAESILIFGPGEAKDELKNVSRGTNLVGASSALKQLTR